MTREEQKNKATDEYIKYRQECGINDPIILGEVEEAYYQGAEWGEKTMIEKACEWLRRTQPQVILPDTTIERFRKAMLEEE